MGRKKQKEEEIAPEEFSALNEPSYVYQAKKGIDNTFEEDWAKAISGDVLVKQVHQHIDENIVKPQQMDLNYNFCQDSEPTDKQLEFIMHEVVADARKKREKADRDYQRLIIKEINLSAKRMEALIKKRMNGKA